MWTIKHAITILPCVIIEVILAIILRKVLINKGKELKMLPIKIIGIMLLVLEIMKQIYGFATGYDLYWIPLHFCSLFIFCIPLMGFYRGKYEKYICNITIISSAMMVIIMLIYPNIIYGAGNIDNYFTNMMSFHTVTFHNLVMFAFIIMVSLDLYSFDTKQDCKNIFIFFFTFGIIEAVMAQLLKTNFNSFYYSNVPLVENIRKILIDNIGGLGQFIYIVFILLAMILVGYLSYIILRLMTSVIKRQKND